MPQLDFKIKYSQNDGLIMSPSELKDTYFFGIPLVDKQGQPKIREVKTDSDCPDRYWLSCAMDCRPL